MCKLITQDQETNRIRPSRCDRLDQKVYIDDDKKTNYTLTHSTN